jgi:nitric oxide reductase NorQ protein
MYLITVVEERTGYKLRPVAGQVDPDGNDIDNSMNVQGDTAIRSLLGVGAILYAPKLIARGKYYQTDGVFCCDAALAKVHSLTLAPPEGLELYNKYLMSVKKGKPLSTVAEIDKTSFLGKLMKHPKYGIPDFEETGFHVDKDDWFLLLRNLKRKESTMIYGPTGSGKTELVMLMAQSLKVDIEIFDMGSALDPTATLVGVHRLEDGASIFDYSRFYHAIQKPGIVLLDELSRAPENTTNLLLPCLDSRRTLYTDIGSGKVAREVSVHPDCVFIATANVGSEYVGVNLLDKAVLSRFFKLELDYPSREIEISILENRTGIDRKDAETVTKICQDIRGGYLKGTLSRDVSIRESLSIGNLIRDGYDTLTALKLVLIPCFEGSVDGGDRSVVLAKIIAH